MRFKVTIQYDGTAYHGWQLQPNGVTVQQKVTEAVERLTGERVRIEGCGRTDAGVHAINYVISFDSQTTVPPQSFPMALNTFLPNDIICREARIADADFHAGRSAVKKRYIYRILNSRVPDAFERNYSWYFKYPIDILKMRRAAEGFLGEHDFLGFASSGFSVKTTVRTIYSLDILKTGDLITIDICGNGFLYNMVRIIAGTLVYAGTGRIDPEDIPSIIASKKRERAGITAPPQGLFLKEVYYA